MSINNRNTLNLLIDEIEADIQNSTKYHLYSEGWLIQVPKSPGIYFIWHNEKVVYVGESASIYDRMKDLSRTVNHTFRRKVAGIHFANHPDYTKTHPRKKFTEVIEKLIDDYCLDNFTISFVPVYLGRKEIETYFVSKYKNTLYNSVQLRGSKG